MCVFCKIINREIPSKIVYEDETVIAFHDINPQAPVHILIVPKEHIETVNDLEEKHEKLIGHVFTVAKKIAKEFGIAESGYRVIVNCNKDGGQEVYHLHYHLLGGKALGSLVCK
ncbi:MAG: histidine triad nucleotide-binding protein [Desulfurobacteriaceae bacterium]